ncbi:glycosyltransferase family 2 [Bifidobacterium ramosum]|uniref:Glycosyltransferase n=1 Tax=Bifidobacterium ramosum TaxID=1798158 RepID=A0A6L4X207_9BIFI|nr:glycosyltransferase [Bifidobacterium ramosum]KAB8289139.1 glycosyltransferase family 2 [Bifidobacterium ramosum]NEG70850.1 glycosyltransferase [Bifidobacterium ramosum]
MNQPMHERPLVSVIVPVYNVERYLDQCMASITSQTHGRLEIILVDDGSTDDSPRMCDAWRTKDARVRVIHQGNGGVASARNAGLDAATGDYIAFADPDDIAEPDMIETMLGTAMSRHCQIVAGGNRNMRYAGGAYRETGRHAMTMPATTAHGQIEPYLFEMMRQYSLNPVWNKLYERSFIERSHVRFDESLHVGSDQVFNAALIAMADRMACIPDLLYRYVSREQSLCNSLSRDRFRNRRMVHEEMLRLTAGWDDRRCVTALDGSFVHQTGVIVGRLFEPANVRLRRGMIAEIARDGTVHAAARRCRNATDPATALAAWTLSFRSPVVLGLYGWCRWTARHMIAWVRS